MVKFRGSLSPSPASASGFIIEHPAHCLLYSLLRSLIFALFWFGVAVVIDCCSVKVFFFAFSFSKVNNRIKLRKFASDKERVFINSLRFFDVIICSQFAKYLKFENLTFAPCLHKCNQFESSAPLFSLQRPQQKRVN